MSKNIKQIFLISIALILILAQRIFTEDVSDISNRKYFPAVKEVLDKAKKTIFMVMYIVNMDEKNTQSEVYQLCNSLTDAKKRGVKIKIILDQSIDYEKTGDGNGLRIEEKNQNAFRFFKKNGIEVYYDTRTIFTHSKVIVVDENIVILGSTNWSDSALKKNNETSVLIKSKNLANSLLENFSEIAIDKEAGGDIKNSGLPLAIYRYFLENENLAGRMITKQDERAFDLYLLILREFKSNASIDFNYDKMAMYLGIDKTMDKPAYRRQIIKTLDKLNETYHLIRYEPQFGKNAKVTLLNLENSELLYKYPEEKYFIIPEEYFSFKWDRKLSFNAKFCYLINLYKVSLNSSGLWWSNAQKILSEQFHLHISTISEGMNELKNYKIIEIQYSSIQEGYESREPAKYKLFDLYDPVKQAEKFENLKKLYSADRVNQAKEFARVVFEDNNPAIVEDIILLIDEFGIEKYRKAINIASQKAADNPKRTHKYVVGILRGMD